METVIITGATSMIGIAIIKSCIRRNIKKIYAVVRPHSTNLYRLPHDNRIKVVECDSCNLFCLTDFISEKCDVFYHIAWNGTGHSRNSDIRGQAQNILHTIDAVKTAAELGCIKFIGAGSQAEYGKLDIDKISADTPANPIQAYGIAKYTAGKLAIEEAKKLGLYCIWVRIFSVYGKYDKKSTMISNAIDKMKWGKKVSFTAGIQCWDYLYEDDAGEAFYLIGENVSKSKIYCLGSGQARQLKEYIMIIRDEINPELEIGLGEIPYTKNTVMNLCADISELQKDTGWTPQISFSDGIQKIINNIETI